MPCDTSVRVAELQHIACKLAEQLDRHVAAFRAVQFVRPSMMFAEY